MTAVVFTAILVLASVPCILGLTLAIPPNIIPGTEFSSSIELNKDGVEITEKDSQTKKYHKENDEHSRSTNTSAYGQNGSQVQNSAYDRLETADGTKTQTHERKLGLNLLRGPTLDETHISSENDSRTVQDHLIESGQAEDYGVTKDGNYTKSSSYNNEEGNKHQEKDTRQAVQHSRWSLFGNQREKDSSKTATHEESDDSFKRSNYQAQETLISNNQGNGPSATSSPSSTGLQSSPVASGGGGKASAASARGRLLKIF